MQVSEYSFGYASPKLRVSREKTLNPPAKAQTGWPRGGVGLMVVGAIPHPVAGDVSESPFTVLCECSLTLCEVARCQREESWPRLTPSSLLSPGSLEYSPFFAAANQGADSPVRKSGSGKSICFNKSRRRFRNSASHHEHGLFGAAEGQR